MTDLSTYWQNEPSTATPLAAATLNAWGSEVQAARDAAIAAAETASAPNDTAIATEIADTGSDTYAALAAAFTRIGATVINAGDYGLVDSAAVDNTAALQAAMDDAAGGVLVIPPGEYGFAGSANPLRMSAGVTVWAYGATLHGLTGRNFMVVNWPSGDTTTGGYDGRSNLTWLGGTLDAHGDTITATTGNVFTFNHCRDVTIRDVTIRRVIAFHSVELNAIDGATVENVTCEGWNDPAGTHPGKEAIQIDCAVSGAISSGLEDNTMTRNVTVMNCRGRGYASLDAPPTLVGSHSHPSGVYYENIRVLGCDSAGSVTHAVRAYWWDNFTVSGNTFTDCGGSGVVADSCRNGDVGPNAVTTTSAAPYVLNSCTNVRRYGAPKTTTSGILTAATNWSLSTQDVHEHGDEISMRITAVYSGSTVTVPSDGNISPDQTVASVPVGYRPAVGATIAAGGGGPGVFGYLSTGGNLVISAVSPGTSFTSGFTTTFSIKYTRALS